MATATPASEILDETDPSKPQEFSDQDDHLYLSLENYCWEDDPEFQSGLTQILSSTTDPSQIRLLTRQAKCFFYSRQIRRAIDFPSYNAWLDREESSGPRCRSPSCEVGPPIDPMPLVTTSETCRDHSSDSHNNASITDNGNKNKEDEKAPYPTSFAEIVELITLGKPIPGIREIPNTLNTAPPSQSIAQQRRKPWEIAQETSQPSIPSGEGSLPSPAATPQAEA